MAARAAYVRRMATAAATRGAVVVRFAYFASETGMAYTAVSDFVPA